MNVSLNGDVEVTFASTPMRRWAAVIALLASPALGLLGCSSEKEPSASSAAPLEPQPIPAALAPKPPSAEYLEQLELGRSLLAENKGQEALAPLERARKEQPEAFAVHNNLCVAYGILQRRDEAVAACEHALTIEPGSQLGKNNLGWVSGIKPVSPEPSKPAAINAAPNKPAAINAAPNKPAAINAAPNKPAAINADPNKPAAINAAQSRPQQ